MICRDSVTVENVSVISGVTVVVVSLLFSYFVDGFVAVWTFGKSL